MDFEDNDVRALVMSTARHLSTVPTRRLQQYRDDLKTELDGVGSIASLIDPTGYQNVMRNRDFLEVVNALLEARKWVDKVG